MPKQKTQPTRKLGHLRIELPIEVYSELRARAAKLDQSLKTYVTEALTSMVQS